MNKLGYKKVVLLMDGATHDNSYLEKFGIKNYFFPHSSHLLHQFFQQ